MWIADYLCLASVISILDQNERIRIFVSSFEYSFELSRCRRKVIPKMSLLKYGFTKGSASSTSSRNAEDESVASDHSDANDSGSEKGSSIQPKKKRKTTKTVRKYDPEYLSYGFVSVESNGVACPKCVVCYETLANSCMAPTKLIRHLRSKHAELKEKPLEFFKEKKAELAGQSKIMGSFSHSELAAIKSSFVVAYEIAKAKKPFTIGEQLLKPCLSKVTNIMLDASAAAKIDLVPLSRNTIERRFSEMASDVRNQLCSRLKKSVRFSLQFDESTDIANEAILLGFVRFVHEFKIVEDIFCVCSLPDNTTGEKIYEAIDKKIKEYQLDWKGVIQLCTDGAKSMTGVNKGLAKRIADVASEDFVSSHCILHREALASKEMSPILNETLQLAVKMINNIKANALSSRIFRLICAEMDSEYESLLLHAEVRWLSRGKSFTRLYELRHELAAYFEKYIEESKTKPKRKSKKGDGVEQPKMPEEIFLEKIKDNNWLSTLAYLADVFGSLNELNVRIQGKQMNCFDAWNKIEAFKKKLSVWEAQVAAMDFTSFAFTNELLTANKSVRKYIQPIALNHLKQLITHFEKYFPATSDPRVSYLWVVNPFLNTCEPNTLTPAEKNQLVGT